MKETRTENGVKNRFISVIEKQIGCYTPKKKLPLSEEFLINQVIKRLR
jgi:hypothetical protein